MMRLILENYKLGLEALEKGVDIEDMLAIPVKEQYAEVSISPKRK